MDTLATIYDKMHVIEYMQWCYSPCGGLSSKSLIQRYSSQMPSPS